MAHLHERQNFLHFSRDISVDFIQEHEPPTSLPIYYDSIGLGLEFSPKIDSLHLHAQNKGYLICGICKNELENPVLLNCFHSFCSNCIAERVLENNVACFTCKRFLKSCETCEKEEFVDNALSGCDGERPPKNDVTAFESKPDLLLQFLVSNNKPQILECANCEEMNATSYCNTCDQPLCNDCRALIHAAKMFSKHEVVAVERRTQKLKRKCEKHDEEFIMFSTTLKELMCINCFRELDHEKRVECTDLKVAYTQTNSSLSEAMISLEDLQRRTNETIASISAIRQETINKADIEEAAVNDLYKKLMTSLEEKKVELIKQIKEEREEKEQMLETQLISLQSTLPILEERLLASSHFSKDAAVFDLLNFGHHVTSQIIQLLDSPFPLQPYESDQATRDLKQEFRECVNSVLREYGGEFETRDAETQSEIKNICIEIAPTHNNWTPHSNPPTPNHPTLINTSLFPHSSSPNSGVYAYATNLGTSESRVTYSVNYSANGANLPDIIPRQELITYAEKIRAIHTRLIHLKETVQELHGDLTKRKCQPNESVAQSIEKDSKKEGILIQEQIQILQTHKAGFEKDWEETITKVAYEREIFYGHLQELERLQNENTQLSTIVSSLEPFVKSLNSVSQRLSPMLQAAARDRQQTQMIKDLMSKISEIDSDPNKRLVAIKELEQNRLNT